MCIKRDSMFIPGCSLLFPIFNVIGWSPHSKIWNDTTIGSPQKCFVRAIQNGEVSIFAFIHVLTVIVGAVQYHSGHSQNFRHRFDVDFSTPTKRLLSTPTKHWNIDVDLTLNQRRTSKFRHFFDDRRNNLTFFNAFSTSKLLVGRAHRVWNRSHRRYHCDYLVTFPVLIVLIHRILQARYRWTGFVVPSFKFSVIRYAERNFLLGLIKIAMPLLGRLGSAGRPLSISWCGWCNFFSKFWNWFFYIESLQNFLWRDMISGYFLLEVQQDHLTTWKKKSDYGYMT